MARPVCGTESGVRCFRRFSWMTQMLHRFDDYSPSDRRASWPSSIPWSVPAPPRDAGGDVCGLAMRWGWAMICAMTLFALDAP